MTRRSIITAGMLAAGVGYLAPKVSAAQVVGQTQISHATPIQVDRSGHPVPVVVHPPTTSIPGANY